MKWKQTLTRALPYLMSMSMMLHIASCGSDDDNDSSTTTPPQEEQVPDVGSYAVTFTALNTSVTDAPAPAPIVAEGGAAITITNDEFKAVVTMNDVSAEAHLQNIFVGSKCPELPADDTNGDGIIDVAEATAVAGKIIVPLDSDLSSQAAGVGYGEPGGITGAYVYERSANFTSMMDDLHLADTNTADIFAKLPQGEGLKLDGKVIIIHGVSAAIALDDIEVQSLPGLDNNVTLPIACGVINKTDTTPEGNGGPN